MVTDARPIPGFPGYLASSDGTIFTEKKPGRRGGITGPEYQRPLRPVVNAVSGYRYVNAYVSGKHRHVLVHYLVAITWIGPRPDGMEIAHLDGEKANNQLANLSYVTHSENERHKHDHGTRGVLTADVVRSIRSRRDSGETYAQMAREHGVTEAAIRFACIRKTWRHVS